MVKYKIIFFTKIDFYEILLFGSNVQKKFRSLVHKILKLQGVTL